MNVTGRHDRNINHRARVADRNINLRARVADRNINLRARVADLDATLKKIKINLPLFCFSSIKNISKMLLKIGYGFESDTSEKLGLNPQPGKMKTRVKWPGIQLN